MAGSRPIRRLLGTLAVACATLAQLAPASAATPAAKPPAWADVPAHFWAKPAIDAVARAHPWMEDFGSSQFKPFALETRARFAHALVLAFGAGDAVDRSISFKDLAPTDPYYPFAAIAVRHHWIPRVHGNFLPDRPVTMTDVHKALVH